MSLRIDLEEANRVGLLENAPIDASLCYRSGGRRRTGILRLIIHAQNDIGRIGDGFAILFTDSCIRFFEELQIRGI
ncbi:hypothetical protein QYF36_010424 [Acer negundo]|nr:hypothetical protein QYF36_010424 [Acer negundo]